MSEILLGLLPGQPWDDQLRRLACYGVWSFFHQNQQIDPHRVSSYAHFNTVPEHTNSFSVIAGYASKWGDSSLELPRAHEAEDIIPSSFHLDSSHLSSTDKFNFRTLQTHENHIQSISFQYLKQIRMMYNLRLGCESSVSSYMLSETTLAYPLSKEDAGLFQLYLKASLSLNKTSLAWVSDVTFKNIRPPIILGFMLDATTTRGSLPKPPSLWLKQAQCHRHVTGSWVLVLARPSWGSRSRNLKRSSKLGETGAVNASKLRHWTKKSKWCPKVWSSDCIEPLQIRWEWTLNQP